MPVPTTKASRRVAALPKMPPKTWTTFFSFFS
jgi:hypothetical protein